jgi:hypothetical protein
VIAPVSVTAAGLSLFFDVPDLAAGRHLAVLADDASASEGGEAEKPNEAHHTFVFRANLVPMSRILIDDVLVSIIGICVTARQCANGVHVRFIG